MSVTHISKATREAVNDLKNFCEEGDTTLTIRTEGRETTLRGGTAAMESEVIPKTTDFKLSKIPLLDDYGEEAMRVIYDDIKENPGNKIRKIVITVAVHPSTMEIESSLDIKLPKADIPSWKFKKLQGIRENGMIRVEAEQTEMFG